MKEIKLSVTGMSCEHCVARVKKAIEGVPGVASAAVDLAAGQAVAQVADDVAVDEALIEAIDDAGFEAAVI